MPGNDNVYRVHNLAADIAGQNAQMRVVIEKSLEVLRTAVPDTFLGRSTHDPAPEEGDPGRYRTTR